jgi:hypothetical protein
MSILAIIVAHPIWPWLLFSLPCKSFSWWTYWIYWWIKSLHLHHILFHFFFFLLLLFFFFFLTRVLNQNFLLLSLVCFESNILFLEGWDTLVEILNVVSLLNIYFMIHDPSKHIIGWHLLVGEVLVDQGHNIVVHWSIGHHQPFRQHTISPLLGL